MTRKRTIPLRPQVPQHLDGEAARLWAELAPQLAGGGALDPAIATSLEIACQAYSTWRTHEARIAAEGAIVKSPAGFAQAHPSVSIALKASETWRKLSKQLKLDANGTKKPEPAVPAFLRRRPS